MRSLDFWTTFEGVDTNGVRVVKGDCLFPYVKQGKKEKDIGNTMGLD